MHFLSVSEDGRIPTLPFLAASRLLADGYGYAGEGDVCCASLVAVLQRLAPPATFTEMFSMDSDEGSLIMQHMGEANYAMARTDRKPFLVRRPFPLAPTPYAPATVSFSLAPGPATLASLFSASLGSFEMVISEGEVLDWGPFKELRTPHFKFKPKTELTRFLADWSRAGASHHQALFWGHRAGLLTSLGEFLDLAPVVV